MKTEREMFEREYNERFPHDKSTLLKSGNYSGWIKQASWEMWQASANREGYKLVPINYECHWCGCTELDGFKDKITGATS